MDNSTMQYIKEEIDEEREERPSNSLPIILDEQVSQTSSQTFVEVKNPVSPDPEASFSRFEDYRKDKEPPNHNSEVLFGMHVGATLMTFSKANRRLAKLKIQLILNEIEEIEDSSGGLQAGLG